MAVRTVIKILPEIKNIFDNYESIDVRSRVLDLYDKMEFCFGKAPEELILAKEELISDINSESIYKWADGLMAGMLNVSFDYLKKLYVDINRQAAQVPSEDIDRFVEVAFEINNNHTIKALILVFLSELCRTSDPEKSFELLIKGFELEPNIRKIIYKDSVKNFQYSKKVMEDQKEIKNCTVCGGNGFPYHNAPCFKMINYSEEFLPSKLYYKCNDCGNLFTKYFPSKYFNRKNSIKTIIPEENTTCNLMQIPVSIQSYWCEILKKIGNYTNGNIFEIGIGNGELISVALDMEMEIDCIEIEEHVATRVANLLGKEIICCDFLDYNEDKKYDIIIMGDVIEHVDNAKKALEKAYNMLSEKGVLWISTPNYKSSFNRLHRNTTGMWNEPWHITYFSKNGLESILKQLNFKVLDYKISAHYNGSMEFIVMKNENK